MFLGANDPVAFKPVRRTKEAIDEAKLQQAYVSHIIKTMRESFRTQHAWLKASEIQQISALEYGCEEIETTQEKLYHNLSEDELTVTSMRLNLIQTYQRLKSLKPVTKMMPS